MNYTRPTEVRCNSTSETEPAPELQPTTTSLANGEGHRFDALSDSPVSLSSNSPGHASTEPAAGPLPRPPKPDLFPEHIPDALKCHRRWLVWQYEWRPEQGKWTKPPFNAITGMPAKSTDPSTWASYDEALAAYHRGGWDGIGFVVGGDLGNQSHSAESDGDDSSGTDFVVFDLDKCIDPLTGQVEAWAAEVVKTLDTYTEYSPSGCGIRLIVRGRKPGTKCRKGQFEMYDHGRYVTVTGCRWEGSPLTIELRQAAINSVYERFFGVADPKAGPRPAPKSGEPTMGRPSLTADDLSLLARASKAANGTKFTQLREGRWEDGYGSQSEADLALCSILAFWTGGDPERIDRLFRVSGLMRDKWDESRGESTYGERTIAQALEGNTCANASSQDEWDDHEHLTDIGNARRLVRQHGGELRYCHPWSKWLVWDGHRWRNDDSGATARLAKKTVRDLFEASSAAMATLAQESHEVDHAKPE